MEKMKDLYEKVAADSKLQEKFLKTMKDAEEAGADAIVDKFIIFAREVGFEVTPLEIHTFFKNLSDQQVGELSDTELDQIAGGKLDATAIGCSVCSLGFTCILASTVSKLVTNDCGQYFQE